MAAVRLRIPQEAGIPLARLAAGLPRVSSWRSGGRCSSAAASSSPTIANTRPATTSATSTGTSTPATTSCLLKRFQEEEDLHVYFLLDCSQSMAFGTPAKFDFARQVAAALAYIALADLDRVAVVGVRRRDRRRLPADARQGADPVAAEVPRRARRRRATATDLARVVTGFVHRTQRRGLAVVVSDLFDPGGFERGLDLLRHHRYEPHIVQIYDRREAEPDLLGRPRAVRRRDRARCAR